MGFGKINSRDWAVEKKGEKTGLWQISAVVAAVFLEFSPRWTEDEPKMNKAFGFGSDSRPYG